MIPKFGGFSGYLPKGEHHATWQELVTALGFNARRQMLLVGLLEGCRDLRQAGVTHLFVDGSFATKKFNPSDYDACYSAVGVDAAALDPVFLDFANERAAMKAKYMGEFFPAEMPAELFGPPYRDFFQSDINGRRKGIIVLDLGSLP